MKYNRAFKLDLLEKFTTYIDTTEFPFLSKFATQENTYHQILYDFVDSKKDLDLCPQFSTLLKKAKDKSESYLITRLDLNKGNCASNMFLLKAMHQFRDNSSIEITGKDGKPVTFELTGKSINELQDTMLRAGKLNKIRNTTKNKAKWHTMLSSRV